MNEHTLGNVTTMAGRKPLVTNCRPERFDVAEQYSVTGSVSHHDTYCRHASLAGPYQNGERPSGATPR